MSLMMFAAAMKASNSDCGTAGTRRVFVNATAPGEVGTAFWTAAKKCSGPQIG